MLYKTIEEYETHIEITQDAMARVIQAGQERDIETVGNKREIVEVELAELRKHLRLLQAEKAALELGTPYAACYVGASW